jgi:hypothetical protein
MNLVRSLLASVASAMLLLTLATGCSALGLPAGSSPEAAAKREETLAKLESKLDAVAVTAQAAAAASAAAPGLGTILASVATVAGGMAAAVHAFTNQTKNTALAQVAASKPGNGSG